MLQSVNDDPIDCLQMMSAVPPQICNCGIALMTYDCCSVGPKDPMLRVMHEGIVVVLCHT